MAAVKRNTIKTVITAQVDLGPAEPHQYCSTVQVKRKKDGLLMTVNSSDWGSKFSHRDYTLISDPDSDDSVAAEIASAPEVPAPVLNSSYTEDELKELGTKELKVLPEFARIDEVTKGKIKTKGDLVKAILAARK